MYMFDEMCALVNPRISEKVRKQYQTHTVVYIHICTYKHLLVYMGVCMYKQDD